MGGSLVVLALSVGQSEIQHKQYRLSCKCPTCSAIGCSQETFEAAVERRTLSKPVAIVDNQDRYFHHCALDRSVFSKKRFSRSFLLRAITFCPILPLPVTDILDTYMNSMQVLVILTLLYLPRMLLYLPRFIFGHSFLD